MNTTARMILVILLVAAGTSSVFATEMATNFKKSYPASEGLVTFDHQMHADQLKDCAYCHSGLKTFGGTVNETFAHNFCLTCHQKRDHAPTECTGCHKRG